MGKLIHCVYYSPGLNPINGGDSQDLYLDSDCIRQADIEFDTDNRWRVRIADKTKVDTQVPPKPLVFGIVPAVIGANGLIDTTWFQPGPAGQYLINAWWIKIRDQIGWSGWSHP